MGVKVPVPPIFQSLPDFSEKEQDTKTPSWICGCLVKSHEETTHAPQIKCKVIKKQAILLSLTQKYI